MPWRNLALYGLFIGAGQFALLYLAMRSEISPGLASLVIQTQVFFTLLLAMKLAREKVLGYQWAGARLAALGLAVIVMHTDGTNHAAGPGDGARRGLLLGLRQYRRQAGRRVNMLAYVIWSSLFAAPPLLLLSLGVEGPARIAAGLREDADLQTWAAVLWQAVGNAMFGYGIWGWLLSRHPAATIRAEGPAGAGLRHEQRGAAAGRVIAGMEAGGGDAGAGRAGPEPVVAPGPAMARGLTVGLLLAALSLGAAGRPDPVSREAEIAQCLVGEIRTWSDGQDRPAIAPRLQLVYDHAGAPPWFSAAQVSAVLQRAAQAWSPCGVPVQWAAQATPGPGTVRVLWSDAGSRGNFGLADVGGRTLSLGPAAFRLLNQRNPSYPAAQTLQMVVSHEMGHFLGLMAHSRRCVDVMSYYTDGKGNRCSARSMSLLKSVPEYRSELPTACDIERCLSVNGKR